MSHFNDKEHPKEKIWAIRFPPWKARSWEEYSDKIVQLLHKIKSERPTLEDLARNIRKANLDLRTIKERLKTPLIFCSLVSFDEKGRLYLTKTGERFLQSRSRRLIYNEFRKNVWGFEEIERILSEKALDVKAILRELRKRGASWRKEHQVRRRLYYLVLMGAVKREGRKYKWVGLPLSHEEIKEILIDLGKMLGYVPKEEFRINGFRIDVAWLRSGLPGASVEYAFEIQLKGNPKSAILNLQECLRRWPSRVYIVTSPEDVEWIKDSISPWEKDIKVIDYKKLEEIANKLNDVINMLRSVEFEFNVH